MKRILFASVMLAVSGVACAAEATAESVEELLRITKVESQLESMYAQMELVIRDLMKKDVSGRSLSQEQERALLELAPKKLFAVMREEMGWSIMKPKYIQIYRESLTQEEVDGLVAFYKSPLGHVVIDKMPAIVQRSMELSQQQMTTLLPKMDAAMAEVMSQVGIQN